MDKLNTTERKIFDYVVKNMDEVKQMSIREFAQACYISTATIFRFVKKLGFSGYKEFIAVLKITDMSRTKAVIPNVMRYKGYIEHLFLAFECRTFLLMRIFRSKIRLII